MMGNLKKISASVFQRNGSQMPSPTNIYYQRNNAVLKLLFDSFPYNTKKEEVFIKVVVVDFIYSTQLKRLISEVGVHNLVDLIVNINFDTRVSQGDPTLVSEIANNNGGVNLFSFASKYCALHSWFVNKRDDYSIYDSVVARLFPKYTEIENRNNSQVKIVKESQIETWRKNKQYKEFNDAIGDFLDSCIISQANYPNRRKIFDGFLWEQR